MSNFNFIDLFAGGGGLSEGFVREGFRPVAHVESDANACRTLVTRTAYHYLRSNNRLEEYYSYLRGELSREDLWSVLPSALLESVINTEIPEDTISHIVATVRTSLAAEQVDLIVGGPPCQAYSIVGRSRDPNRMRGDTRNYLFRHYITFLSEFQPKYFVFENVLGLMSAGSQSFLNEMLALFEQAGYSADLKILNAEDYGVLQRRRRVFIVGRRGKETFQFPPLDTVENDWQTKRDLFYDLPAIAHGDEKPVLDYSAPANEYLKKYGIRNGIPFTTQHISRKHNERDLEIYGIAIQKWVESKERLKYPELPTRLRTHKNLEAFTDRFKVIDPDGHSHTMVAHIAKDGHYYIYPDAAQIRSISVREAARIQSFPDDYFFEGGRSAAFKQIGNAVPPLVAGAVAKALAKYLI